MDPNPKGFVHIPDPALVAEYGKWPLERRLAWLLAGNKLRRMLPRRVWDIQDRFRRNEI